MGVHTNLYPKELVINLSEQEVYSGAALKELSREPFNDCIFPKVRSISLVFSQMAEDEIDFFNIESNVSAFVERIRTMAPMVKNISIAGELGHQDQTPFADDRSSRLVAQLSRLVTELDYHFDYRPVRIDQQLGGLCSLVYSSYGSNDGGKAIMELGRCNASTLRVLDIFPSAHIDIASLIRNSDGSYVQYPCLLELRLNGRPREDVPRSSVFPGAVPFPNLRHLKLKHVYSYSDDTIFRGNAATLESLYIFLSLGEARVLNECGVFTPDSHPKLQNVKVELASSDQHNFFGSDVDFIRFVLSVGPNAPVRTICHSPFNPAFGSMLPVLGEHTRIQVLKLEHLALTLWDTMALVKALPLLSDLHTKSFTPGPWPTGVPNHKLPAYVIARYAPIGSRFRCWHFESDAGGNIKNVVLCVLLLALACPNFDYAVAYAINRDAFMAGMEQMIAKGGFRPHASRLRRLLYSRPGTELSSMEMIQQIVNVLSPN
ncbi:hypothetical protein IWW57_002701 [Coemansia sp. S610]|nr:hypothetical protein IWW57_002701 [Coemansia sp. S610]